MKSKICCCLVLLIFGCFTSGLGQGIKSEALGGLPISKLKSVDVRLITNWSAGQASMSSFVFLKSSCGTGRNVISSAFSLTVIL